MKHDADIYFLALMHIASSTDHALMGLSDEPEAWRTRTRFDGSKVEDGFICGVLMPTGNNICREMPERMWAVIDELEMTVTTLPKAPECKDAMDDVREMIEKNYSI